MMKKVAITVLILILLGIGYQEVVVYGMDKHYEEVNRYFEDTDVFDIDLSKMDNETYYIEYYLDGIKLTENHLPHSIDMENQKLVLKMTYGTITKDFEITYSDTGISDSRYKELVQNMFDEVKMSLSSPIKGNVLLPYHNDDRVSYDSSCMKIKNDVIVYGFNEYTKTCRLNVLFKIDGFEYIEHVDVSILGVSSLDKLPKVEISTYRNKSVKKGEGYVLGELDLSNAGMKYKELKSKDIMIRVRGNSSSSMPKKSYKIKFMSKTAFLSDYKEKEWVLLANYTDQTLLRNALAFEFASKFSFDFTPSHKMVDVYLNGKYQGVYLLSDQLSVSNDRIDISEHSTDDNTGFLVEMDASIAKKPEVLAELNCFKSHGRTFVIKSPSKDLSVSQKEYINDYFDLVLDTLKAKEDYTNLIDEQSFIDWYIVNETFKNSDVGWSSIYFTKDTDGKLKMGPVWDFDLSSGNGGNMEDDNFPEGFRTQYRNYFIDLLFRYPEFKLHLQERWNELYDDVIAGLPGEVYHLSNEITLSRRANFKKWWYIKYVNMWYTSSEVYKRKTYEAQEYYLYWFLSERIKWLDEEINKW